MNNNHIENYLDYYTSLKYPPEYAVLLKGSWGAGKTWFIKKYCEKLSAKNQKNLYVSLYGMSTFAEIEDAFFQQLHPILSSKGMAITGKVLKGLLKTTLKIDWDGDKKEDATLASQIPDLNLPDYLRNAENCILIFDDLERCSMSIENVLGYINYFVEHQGQKVIIVANEDKIFKSEEGQTDTERSYKSIKEKLIGKTFKVAPDIEGALTDFIGKITDSVALNFLSANREAIREVYFTSRYENLRHLKQALWDFERLFISLPEHAKKKERLVKHLLQLLLAYSFEIRHGKIQPSDMDRIRKTIYSSLLSEDKEKTYLEEVIEKYGMLNLHDPLLTEKCWIDFFDKGIIETSGIEESLLSSKYYQDERTPHWVRLWHYVNLTDEDFEDTLSKVIVELQAKEYKEIGIVKHVASVLLRLSDIGLYNREKDQIVMEVKKYIDFLKRTKQLVSDRKLWDPDSYRGLGFMGNDLPEFRELVDYIEAKMDEAKIDSLPDAGIELLKIMKGDIGKFSRMISLCNSADQIYYQTPIFKYIKASVFLDAFFEINPEDRRYVVFALEKRYEFDDINKRLIEELKWLKDVRKIMIKEQKNREGKLSSHILKSLIEHYIDKFIKKLETANKSLKVPAAP